MSGEWFVEHLLELLLSLISAGVIAGFKVMAGRLKKLKADADKQREETERENQATKEGLQALLRDGVINRYDKYMARGYILVRELENVESMYNAYHTLGGNGTITQLMKELRELPHSKAVEHNEQRDDA